MKRTIALAVTAVFILGGCAAKEATKESADPPSTFQTVDTGPSPDPVVTPTNEPPAVEETTPPDDPESSVAKVGATQWFDYEDGLKVQVTKLARFKIGPYSSGGTPGGSGVVATVTIRNGTKATADLSLTTVSMTYGANGNEAEAVYDENYGQGFTGTVTPGKAKTAKFAFAVPKGRQVLDIELAPGFLDYESVHFEGSVK